MRRRLLFACLLLSIPLGLHAQTILQQDITDGGAQGGLSMLLKPPGVRQLGMGDAMSGVSVDPSTIFIQPAALSYLGYTNVLATAGLMDLNGLLGSAAFATPLGDSNFSLGAGGVFHSHLDLGSNYSFLASATLSYMDVRLIPRSARASTSFGLTLKYAHEFVDGSANHAALLDFGVLVPIVVLPIRIGAVIRDFGLYLPANRTPELHLPKVNLSVAYDNEGTRIGLVLFKDLRDSGQPLEVRFGLDQELISITDEPLIPVAAVEEEPLIGEDTDLFGNEPNVASDDDLNALIQQADAPVGQLFRLSLQAGLILPNVSLSLGTHVFVRPFIFGASVRLPVFSPSDIEFLGSIGARW